MVCCGDTIYRNGLAGTPTFGGGSQANGETCCPSCHQVHMPNVIGALNSNKTMSERRQFSTLSMSAQYDSFTIILIRSIYSRFLSIGQDMTEKYNILSSYKAHIDLVRSDRRLEEKLKAWLIVPLPWKSNMLHRNFCCPDSE